MRPADEEIQLLVLEGAIRQADTLEALAEALGLPADALAQTIAEITPGREDAFGRTITQSLQPPFCGVRVTGALFHTQGGLRIDQSARVQRKDGSAFATLFAGGGAACGVSGSGDSGYLSGNGLLSAVVLGKIAGAAPLP